METVSSPANPRADADTGGAMTPAGSPIGWADADSNRGPRWADADLGYDASANPAGYRAGDYPLSDLARSAPVWGPEMNLVVQAPWSRQAVLVTPGGAQVPSGDTETTLLAEDFTIQLPDLLALAEVPCAGLDDSAAQTETIPPRRAARAHLPARELSGLMRRVWTGRGDRIGQRLGSGAPEEKFMGYKKIRDRRQSAAFLPIISAQMRGIRNRECNPNRE